MVLWICWQIGGRLEFIFCLFRNEKKNQTENKADTHIALCRRSDGNGLHYKMLYLALGYMLWH